MTLAELNTPTRETFPQTHRAWFEEGEDLFSKLEQAFSAWISDLAVQEDLFRKHVYENPNFRDSDGRQHRFGLCSIMAQGEKLAFDFLKHGEKASVDVLSYVSLIDQKLDALRHTLHAWHGRLEDQTDVPDSFKKGIGEIADGKVVDLEKALIEKP